jgi:hypothetical protein
MISRERNQKNNPIHKRLKKYLGTNLTKNVKDLYNRKYQTLEKESEEAIGRWKTTHAHGLIELIL